MARIETCFRPKHLRFTAQEDTRLEFVHSQQRILTIGFPSLFRESPTVCEMSTLDAVIVTEPLNVILNLKE